LRAFRDFEETCLSDSRAFLRCWIMILACSCPKREPSTNGVAHSLFSQARARMLADDDLIVVIVPCSLLRCHIDGSSNRCTTKLSFPVTGQVDIDGK
jgi:hypothetical protein